MDTLNCSNIKHYFTDCFAGVNWWFLFKGAEIGAPFGSVRVTAPPWSPNIINKMAAFPWSRDSFVLRNPSIGKNTA